MSTYSNRLQSALQNLLQRVVQFFHPRSSWTTADTSADVQIITFLNASCMTSRAEEPNNSIAGYLPHHWLYEWFSQFHSCGTYSVLSRSPSIIYRLVYRHVFHCSECNGGVSFPYYRIAKTKSAKIISGSNSQSLKVAKIKGLQYFKVQILFMSVYMPFTFITVLLYGASRNETLYTVGHN